jgi:hypothetical protein
MLVRFYLNAIASRKIEKVFWWTLKDGGDRQFDMADMVGLMRQDLTPKYSYYAYAFMTRMIEGKKWVRNDAWGPEIYAAVFRDEDKNQDMIVAWATKAYGYVRISNESGLDIYDIFGTRRSVPVVAVRTTSLPVPLGESPVYVVGAKGMKAQVRGDPGW